MDPDPPLSKRCLSLFEEVGDLEVWGQLNFTAFSTTVTPFFRTGSPF